MINKLILFFDKTLSIILFVISIITIGMYLNSYYFNPEIKGISSKDLSQICILFCSLYILKFFFKIFLKSK
jgi:hypothetical protein